MDFYTLFYNIILFSPVLLFVHFRGFEFLGHLYTNTKGKITHFFELKKKLNNQNISIKKLIATIAVTISSVIYYSMMQRLNKSVQKINKHTYEVSYCIAGKVYKFQTKAKRGMGKILQIIDENNDDVTELVEPYFGPQDDFHHHDYTPHALGYKSLTFNYTDGENKNFTEHEKLTI